MNINQNPDQFSAKLEIALWAGNALFHRNMVTGSSANMSFRHKDHIFITASGACFGRLTAESFVQIPAGGDYKALQKPSKELPLHAALYHKNMDIQAVIHTHSMYTTMWSCLSNIEKEIHQLYAYTPYLKMLAGEIPVIPYAPPGSSALFSHFEQRAGDQKAYLLTNHGAVAAGASIMEAFCLMEEFEASAKISWHLKDLPAAQIHER